MIPVIEAAGGEVRLRREVRSVLVENGRAAGVEAVRPRSGGAGESETHRAPFVISDAGAWATYAKLLPRELGAARARELEGLGTAPTGVTLYLALERSAATLGLRGENYWIQEAWSHEAAEETRGCFEGRPTGAYVSFPSLKDPEATAHTAEVLCLPDYEPFAAWAEQRWQHRGEDYEARKEKIAEGMLALVERHLPGLAALVRYRELSTPLSVEHFTGWRAGAIYGLPLTPERFRIPWLGVRTTLPGFYLAGADTYMHGIMGAAMGGVAAAGAVVGMAGFPRIMAAAFREAARAGKAAGAGPGRVSAPAPAAGRASASSAFVRGSRID
jgi:all-trans-retinol 13,14-reductase